MQEFAKTVVIEKLASHDLRRTCARLCRAAGGEQEQIQCLLGHVSAQTAERRLGCKQRIKEDCGRFMELFRPRRRYTSLRLGPIPPSPNFSRI